MSSAEHSKAVVLIQCLLLPPLLCVCVGGGMVGPCFVVHYLVSSLQSSRWERLIAGCFTLIDFLCRFKDS